MYQRPVPAGAQDIGTWMSIFQAISVFSVITNAGLICFTMDVLNGQASPQGRVAIFIGFQWTLIFLQFVVQLVVPDEPEEVEIQKARMEFITSKLIARVPDEDKIPIAEFSFPVDGDKSGINEVHSFFYRVSAALCGGGDDESGGKNLALREFNAKRRHSVEITHDIDAQDYYTGVKATPIGMTKNPMV